MNTITLYRHPLSGHSHRVQLLLSLLGLDVTLVDVDLAAGEHKQAEFLRRNRFGQVPVLEDGDSVIADSNADLSAVNVSACKGSQCVPMRVRFKTRLDRGDDGPASAVKSCWSGSAI